MNRIFEESHFDSFDLMGDIIPHLIKNDLPVGAYLSDAFWYDLGSLERYERFESEKMVEQLSYLSLNE